MIYLWVKLILKMEFGDNMFFIGCKFNITILEISIFYQQDGEE